MNAYLMAAGHGVRLRPLTDKTAKCMLPIGGIPMIQYWVQAVAKSKQFEKIFINVHHCADQVEQWAFSYRQRLSVLNPDVKLCIIDERSKLFGTAGTLFFHGDTGENFMLAYTDTYSHEFFIRLDEIAGFWRVNPDKPLAGIITMHMPEDGSAGAVEHDMVGNILRFNEKSSSSDLAWSGIMFGRHDFMAELSSKDYDLARDVFPRLCGKMRILDHVDAYDMGRGLYEYEILDRSVRSARVHTT